MAVACESIATALLRKAALFFPGKGCNTPVAPSDFDRLLSGYSLTQTALYRDTDLLRPPYIGIPPYSDRPISAYRLTQTGIPPYSDRFFRGPLLYESVFLTADKSNES